MILELKSVGNPDYGQDPYQPLWGCPDLSVPINSLREASSLCRDYIEEYNLGGGGWAGGQIFDEGKLVAYVSFNGKIWSPDRNELNPYAAL